MWKDITELE